MLKRFLVFALLVEIVAAAALAEFGTSTAGAGAASQRPIRTDNGQHPGGAPRLDR